MALATAIGVGAALAWATARLPFGWAVLLVALLLGIEQGRPFARVRAVAAALDSTKGQERDPEGRQLPVLRWDGADGRPVPDMYLVARGAIEHLAGRFAEGLVAPVFWFVLLGLPGMFGFLAISRTARLLPEHDLRFAFFGMVASRLNEALGWIPVRLAAILVALSALLVPGARLGRALSATLAHGRHPVGGVAWPIAAMAGALGLALGGPRPADTQAGGGPADWLGGSGGRARAVAGDVRRALYLYLVACLALLLIVVFIAMIRVALKR